MPKMKRNKNRNRGLGYIASKSEYTQARTNYHKSVQNIKPNNVIKVRPTQKPVALMEYEIGGCLHSGSAIAYDGNIPSYWREEEE